MNGSLRCYFTGFLFYDTIAVYLSPVLQNWVRSFSKKQVEYHCDFLFLPAGFQLLLHVSIFQKALVDIIVVVVMKMIPRLFFPEYLDLTLSY